MKKMYDPEILDVYVLPTDRKKEIRKSKKVGIPIDHKLTPTATFARQQKLIETKDFLSLQACAIGSKIRVQERENAIQARADAATAQAAAEKKRADDLQVKLDLLSTQGK